MRFIAVYDEDDIEVSLDSYSNQMIFSVDRGSEGSLRHTLPLSFFREGISADIPEICAEVVQRSMVIQHYYYL
jgi:hypothetical protein